MTLYLVTTYFRNKEGVSVKYSETLIVKARSEQHAIEKAENYWKQAGFNIVYSKCRKQI